MLDLYPDVFAYGILLLPKDLKPGEKRPVVVCQHGLEGPAAGRRQPEGADDVLQLASAPSSPTGATSSTPRRTRTSARTSSASLQRKANPLKLSLFSFIVRQHERTLDWLATLPYVDPERIAFYGLSLRRQDGDARAGHR